MQPPVYHCDVQCNLPFIIVKYNATGLKVVTKSHFILSPNVYKMPDK